MAYRQTWIQNFLRKQSEGSKNGNAASSLSINGKAAPAVLRPDDQSAAMVASDLPSSLDLDPYFTWLATCRSLSTLKTPDTMLARISAIAISLSLSTTPVKVTLPFSTMM